jgi:hypothetical protein
MKKPRHQKIAVNVLANPSHAPLHALADSRKELADAIADMMWTRMTGRKQ